MRIALVLAAFALTLPVAAQAEPQIRYPTAFTQCTDAARTTLATVQCLDDALGTADLQLNQTWREVLEYATPAYKARLLASQRAWLKARDADCAIVGERYAGGTLRPVAVSFCVLDATLARIQYLESLNG